MKNKNMSYCYRSFYRLRLSPSSDGKVFAATCCSNMFRAENRMLIKGKIKDAWNSPQFSFQRKLVSQNDWSFCKGARCFFDPYFDESLLLERPLIKSAIAEGKIKLDYLPPVVSIIPSYSCNNNCYMCCYASQRDREKEYKLSDDILKEIEDDIIPAAEFVTISGGEPFFSGRTRKFIERVMSARPKKRLLINTNGVLLHDFGLEKIVETDTSLNITVYGMEEASYESVTAKDYRAIVFKNVQKLLELGYQNMCLIFMVTSKNHKESERFCAFIAKNKDIKGIIRNNCFEAAKYWGLMRQLEKKYHGIAPRLKFIYQSESLINSISRRLYDPFLSMRYLRQRAKL